MNYMRKDQIGIKSICRQTKRMLAAIRKRQGQDLHLGKKWRSWRGYRLIRWQTGKRVLCTEIRRNLLSNLFQILRMDSGRRKFRKEKSSLRKYLKNANPALVTPRKIHIWKKGLNLIQNTLATCTTWNTKTKICRRSERIFSKWLDNWKRKTRNKPQQIRWMHFKISCRKILKQTPPLVRIP